MDLKELVSKWLKDELPNWEISEHSTNSEEVAWIRYMPLRREQVWLYKDHIEFDDDKSGSRLTIMAHDTRFFELLWNRLYVMELGFKKAIESRDFHRPENK